ncbi:hypothetical protein VSX64_10400 [Aurantimonas sp. C2-6-R+9]|nr:MULTISPECIES: hypothetical protein [unclassified Aurantimonas]MEC5290958.1 hypothetical protein [Aurantimonas sp. C2-3-R2]MEC5381287.1 hypothetical protein [Aurantimonas sp. C2-6-R+9]MEC5412110.1 hypothetical protein [Aurantimonas sp. C2-4-R8]
MTRARKAKWLIGLVVSAGVLLLVGVNVHLVYVAFASQPECVSHLKENGSDSRRYRAAKSAC